MKKKRKSAADFGAALSRAEVELLSALPYEYPAAPATPKERVTARTLVHLGLLEQNAEDPRIHRCTDLGQQVVDMYRRAKWI